MNKQASFVRRAAFTLVVMVLAAAAGSAGVLVWRTFNPPPMAIVLGPSTSPSPSPSAMDARVASVQLAVGDTRPEFSLPDTNDINRSITEWDGKLLIINFWATWCPPCLEEIPAFVRLQAEYGAQGVQFLGLPWTVRKMYAALLLSTR